MRHGSFSSECITSSSCEWQLVLPRRLPEDIPRRLLLSEFDYRLHRSLRYVNDLSCKWFDHSSNVNCHYECLLWKKCDHNRFLNNCVMHRQYVLSAWTPQSSGTSSFWILFQNNVSGLPQNLNSHTSWFLMPRETYKNMNTQLLS